MGGFLTNFTANREGIYTGQRVRFRHLKQKQGSYAVCTQALSGLMNGDIGG